LAAPQDGQTVEKLGGTTASQRQQQEKADSEDIVRVPSTSAFHDAAMKGDVDTIQKKLTDTPHDIDTRAPDTGVTALNYAVANGQIDVVNTLVKARADVNAPSESGEPPLLIAAQYAQLEAAQILLAAGANVNCMDRREQTPLHWAARKGSEDVGMLLIKNGASIQIKNCAGYTPYAMAEDWGTSNMVRLLEKHGASRW
jgi:ankyrin repeat protein